MVIVVVVVLEVEVVVVCVCGDMGVTPRWDFSNSGAKHPTVPHTQQVVPNT